MTRIEIAIIVCITSILLFVGYSVWNDDRPTRCFEGFKYKVGSDGALHLMTSGKSLTPVRCDS